MIAAWILIAVAGIVSSTGLTRLLSTSLAVPGTSSQVAVGILSDRFRADPEGSFVLVLPPPLTPPSEGLATLRRRVTNGLREVSGLRLGDLVEAPGFVYGEINTPFDLQRATALTPRIRAALARVELGQAELTGAPALQYDLTPTLTADLRRGELIALVVALAVLIAALGVSLAVLVPFLFAFCTVATVLGLLDGIARATLLVLYVPNLVELIGLGLAIDYSLLVVRRFREDLVAGAPTVDAVMTTMATSGRAVVASGAVVTVGLCALIAIRVPFIQSLGLAGVLVPLTSVVAASTLLPATLALLGPRALSRDRRAGRARRRGHDPWSALASFVIRKPVAVALGAGVLIGVAAAPVVWLELTPASIAAIPASSAAARGMLRVRDGIGPGALTPVDVVIDTGRPGGTTQQGVDAATLRLARGLLGQADVLAVAIGNRPPYVDPSHRYELVIVVPRDDLGAPATRELVDGLRNRLLPSAHLPRDTTAYVGGAPAQGVDFLSRVYGAFPWVIAVIVVLTYLLLVRVFRSLLLPLMAVLLDACTVLAAYGLLVVTFRFGLGADVLGLYRLPAIEGWVPVFLFAVLFGLSMDYEVFIVSRMREVRDTGAVTSVAVERGLAATGQVISAAALIMVGAVSGLVIGRVGGLQELGVGLAFGVLVDATVVRCLLLPSLMTLCGPACWWLPASLARLLRVEAPSPPAGGERGLEG